MDPLAFLRLLDDVRVVEEIERYKWIESEKLGKDIGRERAALEWIRAFGHIWLKIHKPQEYMKLIGSILKRTRTADLQAAAAELFIA